MSGVDIDSVADTAPGRTPMYSRRRLGGLVARLLEHAGGRLDDDPALVLAQPRVLMRRTA